MASQESRNEDDTERVIRREMHSKENARFLRAMPAFRLDEGLPRRLASLMDDLRSVEGGCRAGGNQSGALGAASSAQLK